MQIDMLYLIYFGFNCEILHCKVALIFCLPNSDFPNEMSKASLAFSSVCIS